MGGLGAPAALALAHAGVGTLVLIDDDVVDRTNLHRQILYRDADVGRSKLDAAEDALRRGAPSISIEKIAGRLTPDHAAAFTALEGVDVVLECTDNFATKFLAADVARLARRPIVHGAAIRWIGTALVVGPEGGPCYRCLFEDIPEGAQATCDVAGVIGPVCGMVGALQAHFALKILDGATPPPFGTLATFDGRTDALRVRRTVRRNQCPLCGVSPTIDAIESSRYGSPPPLGN
jgi:molybdopterin/thiamine biosynthesis adenylyltransferase